MDKAVGERVWMSIQIIISLIVGILAGVYSMPESALAYTGTWIDLGLCALLFFVGIDIGKNKDVWQQMKAIGLKAVMVPLMVAAGSMVGGIIGGALLQMPLADGGAVGAGFGWYSLSAVMLAEKSSSLGALAFMANVFRELLALVTIPFVAKYMGYLEAVSVGGATAMDTTLPVVARSTDSQTAIISFITGIVLTLLTPICVSFMMGLG